MSVIELLKVICLGIIEGITEWLPVSSTGHMLLFDALFPLQVSEAFMETFKVVIQLGAILAVVVLFFKKLFPWRLEKKESENGMKTVVRTDKNILILWLKVIVACLPAAVFGLLLDDILEAYLQTPLVIALALIVYGVAFILVENANEKKTFITQTTDEITYKQALLIGAFQVLSLIPGTSCLPAAVFGLLLDDILEAYLQTPLVIALALIVYGVAFILVENANEKKTFITQTTDEITYKQALLIGAFQVLSLIPGTSRSGATILGALLIGVSRPAGAEFTFFLAIPVMLGASALKILKFILGGNALLGTEIAYLLIGCAVAFAVSMLAIRFLMNFVKKHSFKAFGWYRIALGAVVIATLVLPTFFA